MATGTSPLPLNKDPYFFEGGDIPLATGSSTPRSSFSSDASSRCSSTSSTSTFSEGSLEELQQAHDKKLTKYKVAATFFSVIGLALIVTGALKASTTGLNVASKATLITCGVVAYIIGLYVVDKQHAYDQKRPGLKT